MACNNCTSTAPLTTFDVQYFYNSQCFDCGADSCTGKVNNAKCIIYTGPNLSCSGVATNDSVETALQKLDEQICSVIGDYSNYQFNCLVAWYGASITTEAQFVDAITGYACETRTNLDTFITSTFVDYQDVVNTRFEAIEVPGITCDFAGVTPSDTIQQVLSKYCTAFSLVNGDIDVSGITWDNCLTVVSPPTNVISALQLLADQVCQVNSSISTVLPTFNNVGSCLNAPTTTDSLVDTIDKIKTSLCILPNFTTDIISWGCVTPQTDLQTTIQELVSTASTLIQNVATYSGDFIVTQTDPMNPCAGVSVALATPLNQDRFVAANGADMAPGTLIDKLVGVGLTVDDSTNPGQITITSTATADTYKVLGNVVDDTPDYLDVKVNGTDSGLGIAITTTYNIVNKQVDFTPVVDTNTLFYALLDELTNDPVLFAALCTKLSECPCVCGTDNCTEYEITSDGSLISSIQYRDCLTNTLVTLTVGASTTVTVCAQLGSAGVSGSGTVTALGTCAGGTTSTTTTTTTTLP